MASFIFGYVIGTSITLLLLMFGYMWQESKKQSTTVIDKEKISFHMTRRMNSLKRFIDLDFGSNIAGYNEAYREVKYWKEAIERGVFDD